RVTPCAPSKPAARKKQSIQGRVVRSRPLDIGKAIGHHNRNMDRTSFVIALPVLCFAGTVAVAQPGPFVTIQNSNLFFAASTLTTNGVPGLTNAAPKLMVSAVSAMSSHGGSVTLINTQAW